MTSTRETGHVKNVHQLEDLITYCVGYGSAYQPSKADLTVQALTQLLDNSRAAIAEVNQKQLAYTKRNYKPSQNTCTFPLILLRKSNSIAVLCNDFSHCLSEKLLRIFWSVS